MRYRETSVKPIRRQDASRRRSRRGGAVRVLIAEDEPISRRRLEAFLTKWGYTVSSTADGAEALGLLQAADSPRLVLLDRMMPGMDGLEVCRAVRRSGAEPYAYIILLTGRGLHDEVLEGFEAGADDYITKPFGSQDLQARVRTGARIIKLQEELIAAREQLRVQATHDPLTGLLNRFAFFDNLDKDVAWATRHNAGLALVMADLDHFKDINDRFGHLCGDAVLAMVGQRMKAILRGSDIKCRYGGEEFLVLLPETPMQGARRVAEMLRRDFGEHPVHWNDQMVTVSASFGITDIFTGEIDATAIIGRADAALYQAKQDGRNCVRAAEQREAFASVATS
jgi:two-component system, cell cycle response regulator